MAPGGVGRMARVDLTVPAGVAAGDPLEFEHDGTLYNAAVPDGLGEGDVFQIEVSAAHPAGSFTDYLESRAASGDLMDRFVAWFESHGIEEQFEAFLAEHAHLVKGAAGGSVEHSHEWWPVYQAYQAKFDALLQEFLAETGASADDFLTAAKSASGMNDIILKIFLRLSAVHNLLDSSGSAAEARPPRLLRAQPGTHGPLCARSTREPGPLGAQPLPRASHRGQPAALTRRLRLLGPGSIGGRTCLTRTQELFRVRDLHQLHG